MQFKTQKSQKSQKNPLKKSGQQFKVLPLNFNYDNSDKQFPLKNSSDIKNLKF